ncbi:MAG: hypothetical protein WB784_02280 [Rhodanobacteraceae bacterium]
MKRYALLALLAAGLVSLAQGGVIEKAQQQQEQTWSAWGGELGLHWNTDLLSDLGLSLEAPAEPLAMTDFRDHKWFALRESGGLHFSVIHDALQAVTGGSVQARGGYVLTLRDGSHIDLRNLTVRPRSAGGRDLDLVGSDGNVWFYSDHVMFALANAGQELEILSADIRITPELAARLGAPEAANWSVAGLAMNTEVTIRGAGEPRDACDQSSPTYPWPGHAVPDVPGQTYQADLFMLAFDAQFERCQGCDGSGGSDGSIVFAPDSSLKNNVNNGTRVPTIPGDPLGTSTALYTGNIAWNRKFSGSPPNYNEPYKNDQHPFLIWNIYRINADGTIEQIGRSGVKHAFLTVNQGCQGTCYDGNSLGRSCQDTYGTFNNDNSSDLGPRSEIVPATGIWGRCGSIWDLDCTGSEHNNGNGPYDNRLITHESQIDPAANAGASYLFESWYLARQDINILNSMATLSVSPQYNSGSNSWSLSNQSNYKLGPAIDRWVDPRSHSANALSVELAKDEGHTKVAVKAVDLGGGNWRYDYAVMNLDYARAITQAPDNGPDPRVLSNAGFDSFTVPVPAGATVSATSFHNGVAGDSGAWQAAVGPNSVSWSAGDQPTLDWGTMYTFSMTVNATPRVNHPTVTSLGNGVVQLHVANSGTPASYGVRSIVPFSTSN